MDNAMACRIGRWICHTPLVRFSKLDCSTTKRVPVVPIPNDIYVVGKLSLGEIFPTQTFFFWHRWHYSNCCGDIHHGKSAQGGVWHTLAYAGRYHKTHICIITCNFRRLPCSLEELLQLFLYIARKLFFLKKKMHTENAMIKSQGLLCLCNEKKGAQSLFDGWDI